MLAFLHVGSRRVILSPATFHPNEEWVQAQAESFVKEAKAQGMPVKILQRDRDSKYTKAFDRILKRKRAKVILTAYRSPNTNAYVERFIQSIQEECLDRFVVFGEQHLDSLCAQYLAHYHTERPHQGVDNELLIKPKLAQKNNGATIELNDVGCTERLGGLLKHYYRNAA